MSARHLAPRLMPVDSDHMAPTLLLGDAVAVLPVNAYRGEGLYIIEAAGSPVIYRVQSDLRGGLMLSSDNPAYAGVQTFTPTAFADALLGKVAAICTVLDPTLLTWGRA